jgi:hypothetical protein
LGVLAASVHGTPWIGYIGKNTGRAQKNIVVAEHPGVQGDIVLNFHVLPQVHPGGDHHILSDVAVFAQNGAGHDVREMPNFGARTQYCSFVYHRSGVHKDRISFHGFEDTLQLTTFGP